MKRCFKFYKMDKMQDVLNLVDEYIKFEKVLKQTSTKSPYYDIIKIFTSQTKNKIKTMLETKSNKTFYDYMILQKEKSKALKQYMSEFNFIIDYGKIQYDDINDLKLFFILSFKQSVIATFDVNKPRIDLIILNNNNKIKMLNDKQKYSDQTQFKEIENLIYSLKIKNELYSFIYSNITILIENNV